MKKIVSILLVLVMILTSCKASENVNVDEDEEVAVTNITFDKKKVEEVCNIISKNSSDKLDQGTIDSWDDAFSEFDESDDEAIRLYEQSLAVSPNNPIVLTNLANCYLNKGDFGKAKQYASRSLSVDNEYSAAYQVLTSVHLEAGDHCLAAETMIKSAKNCFDDVTMSQMDSFLREVQLLEPSDEFPVKEGIIDEFYYMMNQDGEVCLPGMDTPESQLKLPDFPSVSTMDGIIGMREQFGKATSKWIELMQKAMNDSIEYASKKAEFIDKRSGSSIVLRSVPSLKQIYAFEILNSFYSHKLKVAQHNYDLKNDKLFTDIESQYAEAEKSLPDGVKEQDIWKTLEETASSGGMTPDAAWPIIQEKFTYFDSFKS